MSYKAGEQIAVLFIFNQSFERHVPRYGRFVVWHRSRSTPGSQPGRSISTSSYATMRYMHIRFRVGIKTRMESCSVRTPWGEMQISLWH